MSIPTKNHEYLEFVKTVRDTVNEHRVAWGIALPPVQELTRLHTAATTAYVVNADKSTCNHTTAENLDRDMTALKKYFPTFVNLLEGTLTVPNEALTAMGLSSRNHSARTPIPKPVETMVLTVVTGHQHNADVYASTLQHGHPTQHITDRRKHHGVLLRYRFRGEENWTEVRSTRKHIVLEFGDDKEGKYLHIQGAWMNPRLEAGPWSEEEVVLIN